MTTEAKRAYNKAYRERNRERLIASDRARYEANRDALKAQQKAYRDGNEELKAKKRAYYQANRERIIAKEKARYAQQAERIQAVQREWRDNNPDLLRGRYHRRRARLAGVASEPYRRVDILKRDGYICQICQEPVKRNAKWPDPLFATIDHIVPLAAGGADAPANVQTAHLVCNLKKGRAVA